MKSAKERSDAGQSTSNPALWDRVWEANTDDEYRWWYKREHSGVRGRKILTFIEGCLGSLAGLKSIEVGAGAGVYSRLLAERGAEVTLMDYSPAALAVADRYFRAAGLEDRCNLLSADAFALPSELAGTFDVAMSFGLVEHFRYPQRLDIARAHADLLKPGGVVVISVPNRAFLPHELLKGMLQRAGKWSLGYEGAFTRRELGELAERLGLRSVSIVGSAIRTDVRRYMHIIAGTRRARRVIPGERAQAPPLAERPSIADDYLGADLVLLGRK